MGPPVPAEHIVGFPQMHKSFISIVISNIFILFVGPGNELQRRPEDHLKHIILFQVATGVCALVAFLYYRFFHDSFKKLLHRQKLARMILDNKWYEAQTVQDSGFFTDLQSRSREKIVWFPKIYYQMDTGLLHIRCEISLGKYQDQLLRLEERVF